MGELSYKAARVKQRYSSDPKNFAYAQTKVWDELTPMEKASSMLQEYSKKTADFSKEVGKGMLRAGVETGAAIGDVVSRTSPIEPIRNIGSGIQEVANRQPGVPMSLAYEKGVMESKARPLMLEKLTGENLKNDDGTVNWDFARKFVGRAMEAPTYAYAGAVQASELATKGLLSRIVERTVKTLPEAGVNTALQTGQEGNIDNLGTNFLANALLMSGVSNIVGEIKLPKDILNKTVSDIEVQVGKLTPEQKIDVQDALKQGVKSEDILTNLQKVVKNEVTPDEVAEKMNAAIEPSKVEAPEVKESPTVEPAATTEALPLKEGTPVSTTKVEAAPETVKVPQSQMPVGTGKEKVSRLEARMTGNLKAMTPEQRDAIGLSTYNVMNKKENITAAAEYVTNKPDDGIKILSGEMEPPKGILKNSIYVAMENAAHDDVGLARKLASLSSTRAGQELSILSEALEDSPVKAMREVSDARIQATEKRLKSGSVSKARNEITGKAKETVDKTVTKAIKEDWNSFVDSIKCNS